MGTAWIVPGADVVCYRQTSKGKVDLVERTTVESIGGGRVRLVNSERAFRLDSRLSFGDGHAGLFKKADGWGGRFVLLPADHPMAPAATEES